jgi:DNA-directed RNA polymerase omega subunit
MLNPAIGELIKVYESRYQLVLDISKRARTIAEDAESEGRIILEKPVSLAIDQLNVTHCHTDDK